MNPDNDRSSANERRSGGHEGRHDRRATGLIRERMLATREDRVAAREALVQAHEHAASLRDVMNRQREAALAHRENTAAKLEQYLREADGVQQALSTHMTRLRQANEHLVISALQAQTTTEEVQLAKDQMVHLVHHDFLTGLPNRALLMERLAQAIAIARRQGTRLALLFADLDRFKAVNDSLGHAAGDSLLQTVSKRLLQVIRSSDTACRLGGDEFVVVLTEVANERAVSEIADKIRRAISEPYQLDGHTASIGVTIGVSLFPDDGGDAESLIRDADVAMYHGKHSGRDTCNFFHAQMNARASERQRTEAELHLALQRGEFELHYQPRISLENGTLAGAEALLRWRHLLLGELPPVRFIPVAEECGLILPIGRWVLREACSQAMAWRGAGLACGIISVNLSASQFRHADFLGDLRAILADSGLPPGQLELEITEDVLMRDADASVTVLRELKQIGVLLAVDDFGTGCSSLNYLNQFPIDVLKIDQSFVRDIGMAPGGGVVVSAAIAMGGPLGQRVVAEGVENPAQLQFLRARHCNEGQGLLFSGPLPPDQFAQLLTAPGPRIA